MLDEAVPHRPAGDAKVMREQLQALIDAAARPRITLQIMPADSQSLLGMGGAFVIATLPDDPTCVHLETAADSFVTDAEKDVDVISTYYEMIRSLALPATASIESVEKVVSGRWT